MLPREKSPDKPYLSVEEMSGDDSDIIQIILHNPAEQKLDDELYVNPRHFVLEGSISASSSVAHPSLSIHIPKSPEPTSPSSNGSSCSSSSGSEPAVLEDRPPLIRQSATPTQSRYPYTPPNTPVSGLSGLFRSPQSEKSASPFNTPTLEGVTSLHSYSFHSRGSRNALQRLFPQVPHPESETHSLRRVLKAHQDTLLVKLAKLAKSDLTIERLKKLQSDIGNQSGHELKEAIEEQKKAIATLRWVNYLPNLLFFLPVIPLWWKAPVGITLLLLTSQFDKFCYQQYSADLQLLKIISDGQVNLFEKIKKVSHSAASSNDIENPATDEREEEKVGLLANRR